MAKHRKFVVTDIHRRVVIFQRIGFSAPRIVKTLHKNNTTIWRWQTNSVYQQAYEEYYAKADALVETRFHLLNAVVGERFEHILTNPKTSTGDLLKAIDMYWKAIGKYPKTPAVVQEFYDVGELSSEELKEKLHEMSGKI